MSRVTKLVKMAENAKKTSNCRNGLPAKKTNMVKMDTFDKTAILPKWPEWRKWLKRQNRPKWFKTPE